jgi:hypothetical protein
VPASHLCLHLHLGLHLHLSLQLPVQLRLCNCLCICLCGCVCACTCSIGVCIPVPVLANHQLLSILISRGLCRTIMNSAATPMTSQALQQLLLPILISHGLCHTTGVARSWAQTNRLVHLPMTSGTTSMTSQVLQGAGHRPTDWYIATRAYKKGEISFEIPDIEGGLMVFYFLLCV